MCAMSAPLVSFFFFSLFCLSFSESAKHRVAFHVAGTRYTSNTLVSAARDLLMDNGVKPARRVRREKRPQRACVRHWFMRPPFRRKGWKGERGSSGFRSRGRPTPRCTCFPSSLRLRVVCDLIDRARRKSLTVDTGMIP